MFVRVKLNDLHLSIIIRCNISRCVLFFKENCQLTQLNLSNNDFGDQVGLALGPAIGMSTDSNTYEVCGMTTAFHKHCSGNNGF